MTEDDIAALIDRLTGKRKLAADIIAFARPPNMLHILTGIANGRYGQAAQDVLDAGMHSGEFVADMIWEG